MSGESERRVTVARLESPPGTYSNTRIEISDEVREGETNADAVRRILIDVAVGLRQAALRRDAESWVENTKRTLELMRILAATGRDQYGDEIGDARRAAACEARDGLQGVLEQAESILVDPGLSITAPILAAWKGQVAYIAERHDAVPREDAEDPDDEDTDDAEHQDGT